MESNAVLCWYPHGLSNRLHCLVNALFIRERTGRPVYYYWQLNNHLNEPLDRIFECPLPQLTTEEFAKYLPLCDERKEDVFTKEPGLLRWLADHPGRVVIPDALVEGDIPTSYSRRVLRSIRWHPQIISQFQVEMEKYTINRTVIGMHVRGTDYDRDPVTRREHALYAIKQELPNQRIYLATDDTQLQQEVSSSQLLVVSRPSRNTPGSITGSVVEQLLLSETTLRYYSTYSTYSWVALALSDATDDQIPRRVNYLTKQVPRLQILSQPSRFRWSDYVALYPELNLADEAAAIKHYLTSGFYEQRQSSDTSM